jgi:hypothetical protein
MSTDHCVVVLTTAFCCAKMHSMSVIFSGNMFAGSV